MRWGESRTVALKSLVAPGNVKARQKTLGVINLADDIRELGGEPIHPLAVKRVRLGWQIIAGRDRYSALLMLGVKKVPVRVVEEATAQELHDLEVSENLHRRVDDRDAMIAERVRKVTERIVKEREVAVTNVTAGKAKPAKVEARERIAASLGTTPNAVKQAEHREKVKEQGAAVGPVLGATGPGAPPIDLHGHPMPPQLLDVAGLVKQFAKLEAAARAALSEAKNLGLFASMPPGLVQLLTGVFEASLAAARHGKPTDLCPYCNGVEGVKCKACKERGWVTAQVYASAPAERRGVSVEEFSAGLDAAPVALVDALSDVAKAMAKPRRGMRVTVIDDKGAEHDVTDTLEAP